MKKVEFIGLGYIGLPSAALAAKSGFSVLGVDTDQDHLAKITSGEIDEKEPGLKNIVLEQLAKKNLTTSSKPDYADVFIIVVPTPFNKEMEPNLENLLKAVDSVIPFLREDNLLIIESTCPVGTTEEIKNIILTKRKDLIGKIKVAYCPERVLPGNILFELKNNNRIIGGIDEESAILSRAFYEKFVEGEILETDSKTAELCKLAENSFRDLQISFANELSIIADEQGVNIWDLIKFTNKHPRVNILNPGVGVGGHCIAVDPWFLISANKAESKIIRTAREQNLYKTKWCLKKIKDEIKFISKKKKKKRISISLMGLSYKQNVSDFRESPALFIGKQLIKEDVADIFFVEPNTKNIDNLETSDPEKSYEKSDLIIWLVPHDDFKKIKIDPEKNELDFCGIRQ